MEVRIWSNDGDHTFQVDRAYWINSASHGDVERMCDRAEYSLEEGVLFINAGAIRAVEVSKS